MGGDGVRPFSEGKRGRRRGGSTVSETNDISKSDAALGEAEGRGVLASRGRR
jgi:hypothetical protein